MPHAGILQHLVFTITVVIMHSRYDARIVLVAVCLLPGQPLHGPGDMDFRLCLYFSTSHSHAHLESFQLQGEQYLPMSLRKAKGA